MSNYNQEGMNTFINDQDYYTDSMNSYADIMIDKITKIVQDVMVGVPKIKSAIVSSVNQDGTVNISLPSDSENIYTNIQNQSIYQDLQPGDGVELLLKDGTFSNCWIIAKHAR